MRGTGRTRTSTRGQNRDQTVISEPGRKRLPAFLEYETFEDRQDEVDEPDIELNDEGSWGDENTPQDAVDSESPDFQIISSIRPLWLLYKGRLIWAGARLGRDVREREFFRRRIQAFLDFLADEFPDNTDEDRLLAMQGLFMMEKKKKEKDKNKKEGQDERKEILVKEVEVEVEELEEELEAELLEEEVGEEGKEGEKGVKAKKGNIVTWLDRLGSDGIVYGKNKIISLKMLRTKQGGSGKGSDSCPNPLLLLWLERELKKHPGESPLEWENCKDWIMGINDFLYMVNDKLNNLVSSGSIGLKDRHFHYEASTVQKKRLGEWKKWWGERA